MQAGDLVANRFEVLALAGAGGMGDVYRARDRSSGQTVALKVLSSGCEADIPRFEREAGLVAQLSHPSIVRYIAHGFARSERAGDRPYFVMEWIDGQTLGQRMLADGLSARQSVDVARAVAEAVGAAHDAGVVHRDLKPSNIILAGCDPAAAKVIDFGLAMRPGDAVRFTESGMVIGTPGYMSPEQALDGHHVDARADVFSIGCVLQECLTGVPVFPGRNPLAVRAKVLLQQPAPLRRLAPELPAELEELLARALAKAPDRRPVDGKALAAELAAMPPVGSAVRLASDPGATAPTMVPGESPQPSTLASTVVMATGAAPVVSVVAVMDPLAALGAARHGLGADGARLQERLGDVAARYQCALVDLGVEATLLVGTSSKDPATAADAAARCALEVRSAFPGVALVLQVGTVAELERLLDGSTRSLEIAARQHLLRGGSESPTAGAIVVDAATAETLPAAFDVRPVGRKSFQLLGLTDTSK